METKSAAKVAQVLDPEYHGYLSFEHKHLIDAIEIARANVTHALEQEANFEHAVKEWQSAGNVAMAGSVEHDRKRWSRRVERRQDDVMEALDRYHAFCTRNGESLQMFWKAKELNTLDAFYAVERRLKRDRLVEQSMQQRKLSQQHP